MATAQNDTSQPPRHATVRKLVVQFSASEAFMQKYEEAKTLLSNKQGPAAGFEEVFEAVLEEFIERHSPRKREERRRTRRARGQERKKLDTRHTAGERDERVTINTNIPGNGSPEKAEPSRPTRHIPAAVRDEVFTRDGGKCSFRGDSGKQCGSRVGLHVDHIMPFAKGGANDASNLRLLCASHNQLEAERAYGREFMRQYHRRE